MRVGKRLERFAGDVQGGADGHLLLLVLHGGQRVCEIRALDVLHDEEEIFPGAAQIQHLDDVGVGQRDGQLGLGDEADDEACVARQHREDALDGHRLVKAVLPLDAGAEDFPHSPRGDPLQQVVTLQLL